MSVKRSFFCAMYIAVAGSILLSVVQNSEAVRISEALNALFLMENKSVIHILYAIIWMSTFQNITIFVITGFILGYGLIPVLSYCHSLANHSAGFH